MNVKVTVVVEVIVAVETEPKSLDDVKRIAKEKTEAYFRTHCIKATEYKGFSVDLKA